MSTIFESKRFVIYDISETISHQPDQQVNQDHFASSILFDVSNNDSVQFRQYRDDQEYIHIAIVIFALNNL